MNKRQNKFLLSFVVTAMFLLLCTSFASAAITPVINSPAASSTVGGTTVPINVSVTGYTFDARAQLVNITYYAMSASSANSSWSTIGSNNTMNLTLTNFTYYALFNSVGLEDSNDYIINVTYYNATSGVAYASTTNTGIIVDNTIPQAPTSLFPADQYVQANTTAIYFNATVVDSNTSICYLYLSDNGGSTFTQYTGTNSGNQCYYSYTGLIDNTQNGIHNWYMTASDGTNSTNSALQAVSFQVQGNNGGYVQGVTGSSSGAQTLSVAGTDIQTGSGLSPGIIVLAVVAIVVIVLLVKKKK